MCSSPLQNFHCFTLHIDSWQYICFSDFFFLIIFLLLRVSRALHSIFFSLLLVWWFGWMWKPHHHLQDEFLWVMWSKSHSLPYFLWEKEVSIKLKLLSRWRSLQYCPWSSTLLMFCMCSILTVKEFLNFGNDHLVVCNWKLENSSIYVGILVYSYIWRSLQLWLW